MRTDKNHHFLLAIIIAELRTINRIRVFFRYDETGIIQDRKIVISQVLVILRIEMTKK